MAEYIQSRPYAIRVACPESRVGWVRYGGTANDPIARFRSKRAAKEILEMIREELDEGCIAQVVRCASYER